MLLGEKDDSAVCDALYLQLNQNCAKVSEKDFCWNQHADFLLVDSVQTNFLDAGGGLVILKESFCSRGFSAILKGRSRTGQQFPASLRSGIADDSPIIKEKNYQKK